jgi:hypothetical protein
MDTDFPRDVITINPHFAGDNPTALANQLKTNLGLVTTIGTTRPFRIKIYDAQKAPPSYPLAEVVQGTGNNSSAQPKEIALCLSYYRQFNRKYTRGRLYIPAWIIGGALASRPTTGQITSCLNFHTVFTTGFSGGTFWSQYSPTTKESGPVTNVWVDNEWDIVRSRGGRGEIRQTAVVPNPLP